uniref:Potassium transporter n=1 Tax=Chenopodium quinoa TaxID=63459 RepID=A0A803LWC3_CHEQI
MQNEEASLGSKKGHVLLLAYQSLGLVYVALSISPLYVYESAFSGSLHQHQSEEVIFGVLSLIFWILTLFPLLKYAVIMLSANDNGEGGTLALYSLLRRHTKFSLLPNHQAADEELQAYYRPGYVTRSSSFRRFLERHKKFRTCLLLIVLFAACMVIGDGVINPFLSGAVMTIVCSVLVGIFALQHCGAHKVSFLFAPIVSIWLLSIAALGIYNIIKWNPGVYHALSPYYIYNFFKLTRNVGWSSIGGLLLCITGAEAMFVNLGYYSTASIRVAFSCVVYPCLVLQYMGQAAFLSKNFSAVASSFYSSITDPFFWPMFVLAILAAITASQAVISATFSIVQQCRALGCFPRVKVVHTSRWIQGQNIVLALLPLLFFTPIELIYLSSSLVKVSRGGWTQLVFAVLLTFVMYIWHFGSRRKYLQEVQNKMPMKWIFGLGPNLGIIRVPGISFIYTKLVSGVPSIFTDFITNLPASHQIVVFVCIKSVPIPHVTDKERCIIRYGYKDVAKYADDFEDNLVMSIAEFIRMEAEGFESFDGMVDGWMALVKTSDKFGTRLVASDSSSDSKGCCSNHKERIKGGKSPTLRSLHIKYLVEEAPKFRQRHTRFQLSDTENLKEELKEELIELLEAKEAGVAYIVGHSYIKARKNGSNLKRFVINVMYSFLRKNSRSPAVILHVPHISLIEVGVVYCLLCKAIFFELDLAERLNF